MRMAGGVVRADVRQSWDAPEERVCARSGLRDLTHAHPSPPDRSKPAVTIAATPHAPATPDRVSPRVVQPTGGRQ